MTVGTSDMTVSTAPAAFMVMRTALRVTVRVTVARCADDSVPPRVDEAAGRVVA
jgi:hypothetical protein